LRWHLVWGGELEEWLLDLAEEEGKLPQALADKPEIPVHLAFVWRAFGDLAGDRQLGAAGMVGPLMFTAIDRYAERHGITDPDSFDRFVLLLRAMDDAYREHVAEKNEQDTDETPGP
jgi:hypothetical protein